MHTLRFLLVAMLLGLLVGCQAKPKPVGAVETPADHMAKKRKLAEDAEKQEGPKLRPPK